MAELSVGASPLVPRENANSARSSRYGATDVSTSISIANSTASPSDDSVCSSSCGTGSFEHWSIASLWRKGYTGASELDAMEEGHPVREYYEAQNNLLKSFAEAARGNPDLSREDKQFLDSELITATTERERGMSRDLEDAAGVTREQRRSSNAILLSNVANIVLVGAQLYSLVITGSCSMLAVFLDAALDVTSGLVILASWHVKLQVADTHKYPVGRSRVEPLGIILMACLMTAGTLTSIKESVAQIFEVLASGKAASGFSGVTADVAVILGLALVTKGTLFYYCRDSPNRSVEALAMDHKNDVLASSFAIVAMLITQYFPNAALLDPVGGVLISILIIRNWGELTLEHIDNLLSRTASKEILSQLIFIGLNHSSHILCLDTVRAYHIGSGAFAEVHIVLDGQVPLQIAHDVAESLNHRFESVPGVERCFTHCDTETLHSPMTEHKPI